MKKIMMLFLLVGAGLLLWWWWTGYRRFRTWNWEAFWNESAIPAHTLTENALSDSVVLEVHPQTALEDEPLTLFRIRGLRPDQEVDVRATTKTWKGQTWTAVATFRADDRGEVDLATRVPWKGTYHRADPMGLFWSMRPRHPEKAPVFLPPINGYTVDLTVEAEGASWRTPGSSGCCVGRIFSAGRSGKTTLWGCIVLHPVRDPFPQFC